MNLQDAYRTLELDSNASPEEAKKKYRELTKIWHPDINKDPEAESKLKKINEAYQCVQNGKGNEREPPSRYPQGNPFGQVRTIQHESIEVHVTVDFKESVLGCKKEIKYHRKAKCSKCNGNGEISINNGCKKCGGNGRTIIRQAGAVYITMCPDCMGRSNTTECLACNSEGSVDTDVSVHVSVPAGVIDGNILRLQGMGNYAGSFMGISDQHTDVFCHIAVTPEIGLSIDGKDVVSTLNIPLLDALLGCNKTVKTIFGDKEIHINHKSRNHDEVIISHFGVGGSGNHKIILDVQYPDNIDKLIGALKGEEI